MGKLVYKGGDDVLAATVDGGTGLADVPVGIVPIPPWKPARVYNMSHLRNKKKKLGRHRKCQQKNSRSYRTTAAQIGDPYLQQAQVRVIVAAANPPGNRRVQRGSKRSRRGVGGVTKAVILRSNARLRGAYHSLKGFYGKRGERITKLKEGKKELEVQIRREKKASQEYLDKILADATNLRNKAADLRSEAIGINARAEASINEQQRLSSDAVRKERADASSSSQR